MFRLVCITVFIVVFTYYPADWGAATRGGLVETAVGRRLDSIKQTGGVSAREVAQLLKTTPQTVSRWRTGRSTPRPKSLARLLRLEWLADQLGQVYDPDEARIWLFSPHRDLDGKRPVDLIAGGRLDEVLAIIDRLQSAAYA